ncbi:MAG: serine/threonine protein phosphatase [Akkermansiaceae bacterium]|nr:serine/threonine protein phosphatase [Akkermansiaceae bacterium]
MRIAIGDIHGCHRALEVMLDLIQPNQDDLIVTLGDYIDRGPDSKAVIDTLLGLQPKHNLIHLMGNHEIQMIRALETRSDRERFLSGICGGMDTLKSYGGSFGDVPEDHWNFIRSAGLYHELDHHILVHAGLEAHLPVDQQNRETYYYQRFHCQKAHISGKKIICGHSIQGDLPTDLGYAICIDTCAYGGGWLTALDIDTGKIWQTSQNAKTRELHVDELV